MLTVAVGIAGVPAGSGCQAEIVHRNAQGARVPDHGMGGLGHDGVLCSVSQMDRCLCAPDDCLYLVQG